MTDKQHPYATSVETAGNKTTATDKTSTADKTTASRKPKKKESTFDLDRVETSRPFYSKHYAELIGNKQDATYLDVLLTPQLKNRVNSALIALFLAPLALLLMNQSVTSIANWAAGGQPLSSSAGVFGAIAAFGLFAIIGSTVTHSSSGLFVTSGWALIFTILSLLGPLWLSDHTMHLAEGIIKRPDLLLNLGITNTWSGLSTLSLVIALSAAFAARIARHNRRLEADPNFQPRGWVTSLNEHVQILSPAHLHGDAGWFTTPGTQLSIERARFHLAILITDIIATGLIWTLYISGAPADVSTIAVYGSIALSFYPLPTMVLIFIALWITILTLSAGWSLLGTVVSTIVLMFLPGTIIIPTIMTLTGTVATPENGLATTLSLINPVIAALGLMILGLTWGIHLVRTRPIYS